MAAGFGANVVPLAIFPVQVDRLDFPYPVLDYKMFDGSKGMTTQILVKNFAPQLKLPLGLQWKINLRHPSEKEEPKRMVLQLDSGAEYAAPILKYGIELDVIMRSGVVNRLCWLNPEDPWGEFLPREYRREGNVRDLGDGGVVNFHLPDIEKHPTVVGLNGAVIFNVHIELFHPDSAHVQPLGMMNALPAAQ